MENQLRWKQVVNFIKRKINKDLNLIPLRKDEVIKFYENQVKQKNFKLKTNTNIKGISRKQLRKLSSKME